MLIFEANIHFLNTLNSFVIRTIHHNSSGITAENDEVIEDMMLEMKVGGGDDEKVLIFSKINFMFILKLKTNG